jgi:C1A family cysteine protease
VCLIVSFTIVEDLPAYVNWVEAGAVTPVMDQVDTGKIGASHYN